MKKEIYWGRSKESEEKKKKGKPKFRMKTTCMGIWPKTDGDTAKPISWIMTGNTTVLHSQWHMDATVKWRTIFQHKEKLPPDLWLFNPRTGDQGGELL